MDILSKGYNNYVEWAANLSDPSYAFLFRCSMLLVIPAALCVIALRFGSRSGFIQVMCILVGTAIAFAMPISTPISDTFRAFWVSSFIVVICFLPGIVPVWMTANASHQNILRIILYVSIVILTICNALIG